MQSRRSTWSRVTTAIALTLVLAASVSAQSPLGRLAGTVLDTSGAVLPGATITLTNEGTGQTQTTVSNETGVFLFPQVPVGTYKLDVSLPSFKGASFTGISIAVGQEYSITAKLALGNVSEVVSVEAGSSLVPTTTPEVNQTIDQKQIETLPLNGRNPIELIRLMAGTPGIINRANVGINGGRPTWTELSQDGINIQDNFIRTNSLEFVPNRPTTDNVGGVFDHHGRAGRRQRGRRDAGAHGDAVGHQRVQGQRVRVQPQLANSRRTRSSTSARTRCFPCPI